MNIFTEQVGYDFIDEILFSRNEVFRAIGRIHQSLSELPSNSVFIYIREGGGYLGKHLCGTNPLYSIKTNSYIDNKKLPNNALTVDMGNLPELTGKTVVLVDDIYDSGNTLSKINERLLQKGAKVVKNVVLVKRTGWHHFDVDIHSFGFEVTSEDFLVGCGMDYKGEHREISFIATVKKEDNSYMKEYFCEALKEKNMCRLLREAVCPRCGEYNWERIGEVICQPGTEGSRRHCDDINLKPCPWCIQRKECIKSEK